jgi:hypothetical protein
MPFLPNRFVSSNAQRLLKLDTPNVLTVSSRAALRAKSTSSISLSSALGSWEDPALLDLADWKASGFGAFERFVYNFLSTGPNGAPGEGVRLKLQTPLFVVSDAEEGLRIGCACVD